MSLPHPLINQTHVLVQRVNRIFFSSSSFLFKQILCARRLWSPAENSWNTTDRFSARAQVADCFLILYLDSSALTLISCVRLLERLRWRTMRLDTSFLFIVSIAWAEYLSSCAQVRLSGLARRCIIAFCVYSNSEHLYLDLYPILTRCSLSIYRNCVYKRTNFTQRPYHDFPLSIL